MITPKNSITPESPDVTLLEISFSDVYCRLRDRSFSDDAWEYEGQQLLKAIYPDDNLIEEAETPLVRDALVLAINLGHKLEFPELNHSLYTMYFGLMNPVDRANRENQANLLLYSFVELVNTRAELEAYKAQFNG